MSRRIADLTERERDFIQQYGRHSTASDLAHLLGLSKGQIYALRRLYGVSPGWPRLTRPLRFSVLFQALHGRKPKLREYPRPRRAGGGHYKWSEPEEQVLLACYGRLPLAEIAKRVSTVLHLLTGDPKARRSKNAILAHAGQMGLDGRYNQGHRGINVAEAARRSGVPHWTIRDAVEAGELPVFGTAKYRYIPWDEWEAWRKRYRARKEREARVLASIAEPTCSKQAAMAILGLSETQITRYLRGNILRAWKVPEGPRGRGYWLVSLASVMEVKRLRAEGELQLDTPEYQVIRERAAQEQRALRVRRKS